MQLSSGVIFRLYADIIYNLIARYALTKTPYNLIAFNSPSITQQVQKQHPPFVMTRKVVVEDGELVED